MKSFRVYTVLPIISDPSVKSLEMAFLVHISLTDLCTGGKQHTFPNWQVSECVC